MKKSTIWLLVLIMAVAFGGLLYLQFLYVIGMADMRNSQFEESVKRVLYQVAKNLEYEEARQALEADLEKKRNTYIPKQHEIIKQNRQKINLITPDSNVIATMDVQTYSSQIVKPQLPILQREGSITKASKAFQENLRKRYLYQKDVMDDVILEMVYQSSKKPLNERIDFKKLNEYIKGEMINEGLNLQYYFSVINSNGESVYKSSDYDEHVGSEHHYTQILFKNDPPNQLSWLDVVFPTKQEYIYSSLKFIVPSSIFTVVLLVTFVITASLAFRQKRLTEMKNDFINNLTHEIKTPISTISLASQMLKDKAITKTPKMFNHISGVISDETKRMSFQVDKILQMSLFDKKTSILKFKEMDINLLVAGVTDTFKIKAESFGGKIITELSAENPFAMIDEMHFTNVIYNLLDNAVKYKKETEPLLLHVTTRNESDKLIISVNDNGIGIKKDDLKKIFDKFYRVSTGNVHNVKGFGLGLAYVKKIVTDHKASIRAESELKIGTKFIITLSQTKK